jgi:hypothetical protein
MSHFNEDTREHKASVDGFGTKLTPKRAAAAGPTPFTAACMQKQGAGEGRSLAKLCKLL